MALGAIASTVEQAFDKYMGDFFLSSSKDCEIMQTGKSVPLRLEQQVTCVVRWRVGSSHIVTKSSVVC